jgi:secondary thiamine-phosphate synthase enzyme
VERNRKLKRRRVPFNKGEGAMAWFQHEVELAAHGRGIYLITREVVNAVPELARMRVGLLHVFIKHTSASLTLNENADADVRGDMERALSELAPESYPYVHSSEGPDDMPAHVKASLMGSSVSIPVTDGRLGMGVWQGIYLCEHREAPHRRRLVLTLTGEE